MVQACQRSSERAVTRAVWSKHGGLSWYGSLGITVRGRCVSGTRRRVQWRRAWCGKQKKHRQCSPRRLAGRSAALARWIHVSRWEESRSREWEASHGDDRDRVNRQMLVCLLWGSVSGHHGTCDRSDLQDCRATGIVRRGSAERRQADRVSAVSSYVKKERDGVLLFDGEHPVCFCFSHHIMIECLSKRVGERKAPSGPSFP